MSKQKKPKKTRRDTAEIARSIVEQATGENLAGGPIEAEEEQQEESRSAKSGRLGGKKGGPARSAKLTPEERSRIARKAAEARWKSKR